jgi:hypothetical protein
MSKLEVTFLAALTTVIIVAGCGSAERREGIEALERVQGAVHGLSILVSAGATKAEYSQRFGDVLLKVGDLSQHESETLKKFPKGDQDTVEIFYTHVSRSIDAYKAAREYFGDTFEGYGCEGGCSFFPEDQYDAAKKVFPNLAPLTRGPEFTWYKDNTGSVVNHSYRRSDMLRALWAVARDEDNNAEQLIDQLKQK